jgi:hypothetical protein
MSTGPNGSRGEGAPITTTERTRADWGINLDAWVCEHCEWVFFTPDSGAGGRCPHCFADALNPLTHDLDQLGYSHPPEKLLPFTLAGAELDAPIRRFAKGIPFPPADLKPEHLRARFQPVYVPMWLVDTRVDARWKAEAGFDYQVVSHRDRYEEHGGGWQSVEYEETRVRWEPRLGNLARTYENVPAPALEDHAELQRALGGFEIDSAQPYQPEAISNAWVRLPDRPPQDAWPDVAPALRARAIEECRVAAEADHLREFRWTPAYRGQHWTQLLLPVYTSFYLDDDGAPQAVTVHGTTGQIAGARRGSMKRAQRVSLVLLLIAVAIGFFSLLGIAIPGLNLALMPLGILGLALAFLLGLSSVFPIAAVWRFNRASKRK